MTEQYYQRFVNDCGSTSTLKEVALLGFFECWTNFEAVELEDVVVKLKEQARTGCVQ